MLHKRSSTKEFEINDRNIICKWLEIMQGRYSTNNRKYYTSTILNTCLEIMLFKWKDLQWIIFTKYGLNCRFLKDVYHPYLESIIQYILICYDLNVLWFCPNKIAFQCYGLNCSINNHIRQETIYIRLGKSLIKALFKRSFDEF